MKGSTTQQRLFKSRLLDNLEGIRITKKKKLRLLKSD
jgi:hypothetical protein